MIRRAGSVAEAAAAARDGAILAAGLTALLPAWGTGGPPAPVCDLSGLDALRGIGARIGALVTLETLRTHPASPAPLAALLLLVAGLGVRTQGTVGGNLGWGQGDLAAPLLALGATVETADGPASLEAIPPRTLVTGVAIPPAPDWFITEKVGHRAAFSPTLVTIAASARRQRGRLAGVRLAAGGGVTPAQRLPLAEALLEGADPERIDLAGAIAAELRTGDDPLIAGPARAAIAGRVLAWHVARALAA